MAESGDGQERTEEPTPKRQQEAKEKGQVPRSRELLTFGALVVAAIAFMSLGEGMMNSLTRLLREGLTLDRAEVFDTAILTARFLDFVIAAVLAFLPFFLLMILAAFLAAAGLGGFAFSAQALQPKLSKLDPVKGMTRVFSLKGLLEMLKSFAKFVLVATVAVLFLSANAESFLGLGNEPLSQGLAHMAQLALLAFLLASLGLLLVVAIDVPFQLWDHNRQLKMTKQEVKEEYKQSEGSPEVKGKIRQMQMEMSQRRMMEEVPQADVVVTNPSHYAVALRYEQGEMDAPTVVAKGADLVAARIRGLATDSGVPVLSAPPLARALYHSTEIGDPIPSGLYRAVAQILAYVYHLRQGPVYDRGGTVPFDDLPIPEELRRDE